MGWKRTFTNVYLRPKAEVRGLGVSGAMTFLLMTAIAYKLSVRATQIADSDRQKLANSGPSWAPRNPCLNACS